MLLSHFNRELDKTAIISEFLEKTFRNLEKLFVDRTFPLSKPYRMVTTVGTWIEDYWEIFVTEIYHLF